MTEPPAGVYPATVRPYGPPWAGVDDARRLWPDAKLMADDTLTALLAAANGVCRQYAPYVLDFPKTDPETRERLTTAVVLYARDLWTARGADETGDVLGVATFTPRPMSAQVQLLLRPRRGPMVG